MLWASALRRADQETSLYNPHLLVLGQGHGQALEDDLLSRKNRSWNGQRNLIDPAAPFKNWKHEISFAGLCDQLLVICCIAVNFDWIFVKLLESDQICSCEVSAATHLLRKKTHDSIISTNYTELLYSIYPSKSLGLNTGRSNPTCQRQILKIVYRWSLSVKASSTFTPVYKRLAEHFLVDCPTQLICTRIFICCLLWSMTKLKEHSREIC